MAGNSLGQSVRTGNRNQRAAPLMEPDEGLHEGSGKAVGNNLRRTICPRKRDATETPLFPQQAARTRKCGFESLRAELSKQPGTTWSCKHSTNCFGCLTRTINRTSALESGIPFYFADVPDEFCWADCSRAIGAFMSGESNGQTARCHTTTSQNAVGWALPVVISLFHLAVFSSTCPLGRVEFALVRVRDTTTFLSGPTSRWLRRLECIDPDRNLWYHSLQKRPTWS